MGKPLRKPISFVFCSFLSLFSYGQLQNKVQADSALKPKINQWIKNNDNNISFEENKGQMADMTGKPLSSLLFKTNAGNTDMYITTGGLSYVFKKLERHKRVKTVIGPKFHNPDSIAGDYCRADMELIGADIRKENIIKEGESIQKTDYYLGGICPDGILGVRSYEKITIKNIYPGIDWLLYNGSKGLEYDFIVHPNADPSTIKWKYKWTDTPKLKEDSSLVIKTPFGNITEGVPVSYDKGTNSNISTKYKVKNGEIGFNVGEYDKSSDLIIDPVLIWATYYGGGPYQDCANSISSDGTNVWVTGTTLSTNFPTLNPGGGAYFQGTYTTTYGTAFILSFTTAGVLKWATYYGGDIDDEGQSIYSDGNNVWVTGFTESPNFPTLNPGAGTYFQGTYGGVGDAFILEFKTNGTREWATYYGGTNEDGGNSIYSDGTNVWVTGYTSSTKFPVLNPGGNAYFQDTLGGDSTATANAFIGKFNLSGNCLWSTYFGGSQPDVGQSIQSDGINVWLTGEASTGVPILNPGGGAYFQDSSNGMYVGTEKCSNAYISKFNTSCILKWSTYYGGSGYNIWGSIGGDGASSIYSDGTNVWVTGHVQSTNFPIYNPGGGAYFQATLGKPIIDYEEDAFILSFDTSGVRKWATYYGGSSTSGDEGMSIQSDGKNVWVSGYVTSANFPTYNPGGGAYYEDSAGATYILQFSTLGIRRWATLYDIGFGGYSISSDGKDVWVTGRTVGNDSPTLDPGGGAYYQNNNHGAENAFILEFNACTLTGLTITPQQGTICEGSSITLTATGASWYDWNPSNGLNTSDIANPVASPSVTTTYTVEGCFAKDSVTIVVNPNPSSSVCCDTNVSIGQSANLSLTPALSSYSCRWIPADGISCDTCPVVKASPNVNTTYFVIVTDSLGCSTTDTVTVDISCGHLFIPEVFSPNGDGQNDYLYVRDDCIKTMDFMIFDRWGNKVFETTDQNIPWDGRYKGEAMNTGNYVFYLTATMYDGTTIQKKGNITLVR